MSRAFRIGCTVEVANRFEELGAHVRLDGDVPLYPGDRVIVHGPPIAVPYGESHSERRPDARHRPEVTQGKSRTQRATGGRAKTDCMQDVANEQVEQRVA